LCAQRTPEANGSEASWALPGEAAGFGAEPHYKRRECKMNILNAIKESIVFIDGGTGTELQKQGLTFDPVLANLSHPHIVQNLHKAYVNAGANIITANTFGAYSHKYDNFAEIIDAAFNNAKAASKANWIALDMGPTGLLLEPYGDVPEEEVAAIFAQTIACGVKNGADLILIETMMDLNELEIAVTEAKKANIPVFATMSFNANGRTMYGTSIQNMVDTLTGLNVDALGMNCGEGLDPYTALIPELLSAATLPVILQPNAGLPEVVDGVATYNISPQEYADFMAEMAGLGVKILGGCCGTEPAHIAKMVSGL